MSLRLFTAFHGLCVPVNRFTRDSVHRVFTPLLNRIAAANLAERASKDQSIKVCIFKYYWYELGKETFKDIVSTVGKAHKATS